MLLTSVDIFLVPFQGLLAFQPLPTAVGFAHKPGIPSASLLVLLKTIRQVARGAEEVITIYLQTLNITAGFCNPCLLGHASCRSLRIILCINYVGKKEVLKFFNFLSIMLTNSKCEMMHAKWSAHLWKSLSNWTLTPSDELKELQMEHWTLWRTVQAASGCAVANTEEGGRGSQSAQLCSHPLPPSFPKSSTFPMAPYLALRYSSKYTAVP